MFKKLLKYEFQSVGKWYVGIYAGALALSAILGFWLQALNLRTQAGTTEPGGAEMVLFGTSFMTFGILIAALGLSTFFMVINRFRKNVYGRQGYLTMTLPVSSHHIILSKLLASLVWYLLAGITIILSIGIVLAVLMLGSEEFVIPELQTLIQQIDWSVVFAHLFYSLIESTMGILLIYFSISVGQLFKDHRLLFAILIYIGISIVVGVFGTLVFTNYLENLYNAALPLYPSPILALINIILAFAYYFGTHFIMTKKLNLQ
ncbi:TPA: ABC transporter permease [Streptococcus suis]|uniref:ABC transporter permease n=1 Tax=Streptococcus suis TaxID=1307 RepID=UPI000CF5B1E6|nr:ABC transporter permease [Streptococcus suis]NQL54198.1 ABC transporter permease [Streptococcus suis]NQM24483.1 ABC transporter permease [Streptococcus suis]HEM4066089.1 ABC transporter permease [Streptococcus suis]HEM4274130.1 ABC transporter permease [Streptococcus suis]HEM5171739.1 ABC transporter permease [Streptococcus suis]